MAIRHNISNHHFVSDTQQPLHTTDPKKNDQPTRQKNRTADNSPAPDKPRVNVQTYKCGNAPNVSERGLTGTCVSEGQTFTQ